MDLNCLHQQDVRAVFLSSVSHRNSSQRMVSIDRLNGYCSNIHVSSFFNLFYLLFIFLFINHTKNRRKLAARKKPNTRARSVSQANDITIELEERDRLKSAKKLWNQSCLKISMDLLTVAQLFLSLVSVIESLQTFHTSISDFLYGRLLYKISIIFVLLFHYFKIVPDLRIFPIRFKVCPSLSKLFHCMVALFWLTTAASFTHQVVLLHQLGLHVHVHVRLQITLLMALSSLANVACIVIAASGTFRKTASGSHQDLLNDLKYVHPYSSIISRATFSWFFEILKIGYLQPIRREDLGSLPKEYSSEHQFDNFIKAFESDYSKCTAKNKPVSLWRCTRRVFTRSILIAALLRLLADVFGLFGPISIQYILEYVNKPHDREAGEDSGDELPLKAVRFDIFIRNGYLITFLVLCSTFLQSTFSNSFSHLSVLQGIQFKSGIQNLIYKKALRMAPSKALDMGTISNFMSSDTHDIMMLFSMGHYLWAIPLKVSTLMCLLYLQLGVSVIIGASVVLILTSFQYLLGKMLSNIRHQTVNISDKRLRKTNELLSSMKLLKLLNWETLFSKEVESIREQELKYQRKDAILVACISILTQATSIILALVALTLYPIITGENLTAAKVFTGLALFNQLTVPLNIIPVVLPMFISALNSVKRISAYLSQPEVDTYQECEKMDEEPRDRNANKKKGSLSTWIECHGGNLDASLQLASHTTASYASVVAIENGFFTWNPLNETDTLRKINLSVAKGELTVITGPVGSGKSSLLLAMLNEMIKLSGKVVWAPGNCRVGYLSQNPWLYNVSLRENIVFGSDFDAGFYERVISMCCLQADINLLPGQSRTEIGDRGINLSGGQRQRVGLARAIYADTPTFILDDPFSALDPKISKQIFHEAILGHLLAKKKTVILVSHDFNVIKQAHHIVVMRDGFIDFFGTFKELEQSDVNFFQELLNNQNMMQKVHTEITAGQERKLLWRRISKRCLVQSSSMIESSSYSRRSSRISRQTSHDNSVYLEDINDGSATFHSSSDVSSKFSRPSILSRLTSNGSTHSRISSDDSRNQVDRKPSLKGLVSLILKDRNVKAAIQNITEDVHRESIATLVSGTIDPAKSERICLDVADDDGQESGLVSAKIYWLYLRSCSHYMVLFTMFFMILSQVSRIYTDFWLAKWTDSGRDLTISPNETVSGNFTTERAISDLDDLDYYIIGYSFLSVTSIVISLLANILCQLASLRAVKILHKQLLDSVVKTSVRFFDNNPIGRILNRFSVDIATIDKDITGTLPRLLRFVLLCISAILVNVILTSTFILMAVIIMVIYYVLQSFFRATSIELQRIQNSTISPIISHFDQTLSGLSTIRAFRQGKFFKDILERHIDNNNLAFLMVNCANCWLGISLDYLGGLILSTATITALVASSHGYISQSFVGLCISYTLLLPIYLNWVVRNLSSLEMYMSAVERVHRYSSLNEENKGANIKNLPAAWPSSGSMAFVGVRVSYEPTQDPILRNINLSIKSKEKIGICGKSGSGKSSIIMSLVKMVDIQAGSITIDGQNISFVSPSRLRDSISLVPQEPVLFSGNIRQNLDPFHACSDEEIWQVLEKLDLKSVINDLYEVIDEDGHTLSQGQRQLICFARALLKKSSILILDEATSSLDSHKEELVLDLVKTIDRTVISIAHRIATLLKFDRIVVIDNGTIAEEGSPKDLMGHEKSLFRSLLRLENSSE